MSLWKHKLIRRVEAFVESNKENPAALLWNAKMTGVERLFTHIESGCFKRPQEASKVPLVLAGFQSFDIFKDEEIQLELVVQRPQNLRILQRQPFTFVAWLMMDIAD